MSQEPEFDPKLESSLRQIAPARVDDQLSGRLEQAIADAKAQQQPVRPKLNWRFWLIPSAAVATVALLIALNPSETRQNPAGRPSSLATAQPTTEPNDKSSLELFPAHQNNMVNTRSEGIIHSKDNQPFQKIRMQMVDSYTWKDPSGPTRVQYTVPSEEHLLIPLEIH
ncbi:MAG: hypothetical protein QF600_06865 [Verrucomicrobiota bacterium]|jgi:hypothetical protein|nr:hypothetical protein [Verrucomicrobiota bacterium]